MFFASLIGLSMSVGQFIRVWNHHKPLLNNMVSTNSTSSIVIHPEKDIALTFDDGPYATSTSQILDILEREHIPATFFLIGKNVLLYPDQVHRELNDGDVIGNHSYSHAKNLAIISLGTLRSDISHAQAVIVQVSGKIPHLFRAP